MRAENWWPELRDIDLREAAALERCPVFPFQRIWHSSQWASAGFPPVSGFSGRIMAANSAETSIAPIKAIKPGT